MAGSCSARSNRRACAARSSGACGASIPTAPTGARSSAPSCPAPSPSAFHFQTQLSDGTIVAEEYYNQNSSGFGSFVKFPPAPPDGHAALRPRLHGRSAQSAAAPRPARQRPAAHAPAAVQPVRHRGADARSPAATRGRPTSRCAARRLVAARRQGHASVRRAGQSPAHRLVARPGQRRLHGPSAGRRRRPLPDQGRQADRRAGRRCCSSRTIRSTTSNGRAPWCRTSASTASTSRSRLPALAQRRQAVAAPAGGHAVRPGRHVEPVQARELSRTAWSSPAASRRPSRAATTARGYRGPRPVQHRRRTAHRSTGATRAPTPAATRNGDIHAIRILAMEPTTDRHSGPKAGRTFRSHASERLRILGEIPVRKFGEPERQRPEDSRSIPTAIPTPASSPRSRPTSPSPSRRSTRTAWC